VLAWIWQKIQVRSSIHKKAQRGIDFKTIFVYARERERERERERGHLLAVIDNTISKLGVAIIHYLQHTL
jgi:hypothetical protein